MKNYPIKYSLVVTCYYEERSVGEFYTRARQVFEEIGEPYEMIFTNDGSTDATYQKLCQIFENDEKVSHVIDLTRNYGQGAALTAGLERASGEFIVYLDSDLQLDPEDIPKLIDAQKETGHVLVRGYRVGRKDPVYRRVCSWLVNHVTNRTLKIRDVGATYLLFSRRLIEQFGFNRWYPFSKSRFFVHFNRIGEVPVSHHARRYGKSGQPLVRLWQGNITYLINASELLFQYIALGAVMAATIFFARVVIGFIFGGKILSSVSNGLILNAIAIMFFVLLGVLCLVGEFCIRIFRQGEKSPAYMIREMRSRKDDIYVGK